MPKNTTTSYVSALVGLVLVTGGCMQKPNCPELGSCGGPVPAGTWILSPGHPSCIEDLYTPPTDPRLAMADQPAARTPPPEPALYDWCDLLVATGGNNIQAHPARFYYESGPIGAASVSFSPIGNNGFGTFSAGITRTGTFTLDFPAVCMREFGAMDNRLVDPANDPMTTGNVCKQLEVPLRASGLGEGSYRNTTCDPNPADPAGCLCTFDVTETGGPAGSYQVLDHNTLLMLINTNFPEKITYCNKGDSLQLTGANGDYLFGQKGLRTFDLSKDTSGAAPMPTAM